MANTENIAVLGLGYVGLPVAVALATKFQNVIGFDISNPRVKALQDGLDWTNEIEEGVLRASSLKVTSDPQELKDVSFFIVTVPTPIDDARNPDLSPLAGACELIGQVLSKGAVVVFESTVYPGVTEEFCGPLLERTSGMKQSEDFFLGYSPERINPADKTHRLPNIVKVTSGSTPEIADKVDALYASIITAGTHKAPSIKVAEAAKVIENTQRDVNIALVNELALIFNKLDIDTQDVLDAAGTKWNFLPFRPGLVGGHCIGVDPYYLTQKAQSVGYHPEVVLAGRRINDGMGCYIVGRTVREMIARDIPVKGSRALVMGLAFKENCPDLRNTRVVDIIRELESYGIEVDVYDPWVDAAEAKREYGVEITTSPHLKRYDCVVVSVAHHIFERENDVKAYCKANAVIFDVKGMLPRNECTLRL